MSGVHATSDFTSMTGLEQLRALRSQFPARTGIGTLLDMRMTDLAEGRVGFELDTRPELGNPLGTVHGGVTATLLDSAMGCAVHSALPAGRSYTTVDLAITYLRAVPFDGRSLRAEGVVVHLGGRIATAEGKAIDGHDRLVATATTTCLIFRERPQ